MTRRRIIILTALAVVLAAAGAGLWYATRPNEPAGALDTRTVQAGEVTVTITPLTLDPTGARFRIVLDTHTGSLDLDLTQNAQLLLNGQPAPPGTWDGAAPGGHHREGTLTFTTSVPTAAAVELHVTGLPAEVAATWTAP